jgi:ABC-type antimicrobial peptide transport system ATPase subunit
MFKNAKIQTMQIPSAPYSDLLVKALREDSNLVVEWLWYAANMTSKEEQRYCLQRALLLDPEYEIAVRCLNDLDRSEKHSMLATVRDVVRSMVPKRGGSVARVPAE